MPAIVLDGGMTAWRVAELPVSTIKIVGPDAIEAKVVDVRQRNEYVAGLQTGEGLARAQRRQGTFEPAQIECFLGHESRRVLRLPRSRRRPGRVSQDLTTYSDTSDGRGAR